MKENHLMLADKGWVEADPNWRRNEDEAERFFEGLESVFGGENGGGGAPLLVVLCGPSHAGKTTFTKSLGEGFTVVSSDQIRKRLSWEYGESEPTVWTAFDGMKKAALNEKGSVVLDACHLSEEARWHALQGVSTVYRKIVVVFDAPLRTVRERCLREGRMPLEEVERMWWGFQRQRRTEEELKAEGFDEVYFVRGGILRGAEVEARAPPSLQSPGGKPTGRNEDKNREVINVENKPIKEFRAGSVRATLWENSRSKDDREFSVISVTIERRYQDGQGEWKATNSFSRNELPLVQLVAAKAFEFIAVTERDPRQEAQKSK